MAQAWIAVAVAVSVAVVGAWLTALGLAGIVPLPARVTRRRTR